MKVLIVNSARKFTGEAAHALDLAEQLALQGHTPLLVLREKSPALQRAEQRKLPVAALLSFGTAGKRVKSTLADLLLLRALLKREQPDILHCHRGNDHGLGVAAARLLPHAYRPAVVRTRHRVMSVRNTAPNRWLFRKATHAVIAVSRKSAESFGAMTTLIKHKLQIIYSAVDTAGFTPERRSAKWRREHGVAEDEPLVGLIARLQRVKGQEPFLRAAALVLQQVPRARFMVAGTGRPHKKQKLEQLAAERGISDRLIILDWLEDVQTATASLDVGVLASLGSEGSSRVTYEYMASGVPVIATAVGCLPEVINEGATGLLVPPGDVDALAAAILKTLNSAELRNEMQAQARLRIQQFHNRERWVKETVEVYEKAIERRKGLRV